MFFPVPGIEPGPPGILTTRPHRIYNIFYVVYDVYVNIAQGIFTQIGSSSAGLNPADNAYIVIFVLCELIQYLKMYHDIWVMTWIIKLAISFLNKSILVYNLHHI